MKTLKFESNLIGQILSGEKTSTWRLFDDKDLKKDDELTFIERETGKEFAKAIITSVTEKRFKDLTEADMKSNGGFISEKEMYEIFKKHYGLEVTPVSILKVVYFKLQ